MPYQGRDSQVSRAQRHGSFCSHSTSWTATICFAKARLQCNRSVIRERLRNDCRCRQRAWQRRCDSRMHSQRRLTGMHTSVGNPCGTARQEWDPNQAACGVGGCRQQSSQQPYQLSQAASHQKSCPTQRSCLHSQRVEDICSMRGTNRQDELGIDTDLAGRPQL